MPKINFKNRSQFLTAARMVKCVRMTQTIPNGVRVPWPVHHKGYY